MGRHIKYRRDDATPEIPWDEVPVLHLFARQVLPLDKNVIVDRIKDRLEKKRSRLRDARKDQGL